MGLFVGFLPVLLYSSDELELSCGIIGNSGTNIRKSSVSARITIKKSCMGLFVGFLPVLLYSSDELELSCGIIGNSGTNIRKSYTPSLVLSRYFCHQKFNKKNRVI